MRSLLCGIAAVLVIAGSAHADASEDGNAGLNALNSGDYDKAVDLFTRAINSGELAPDDQEFALANRGRAYFKEGHLSEAIVDLDRARQMKPDDTDAQNDLVSVLSSKLPADAIPGRPKASFWGELGKAVVEGAVAGIVAGSQGDGQ